MLNACLTDTATKWSISPRPTSFSNRVPTEDQAIANVERPTLRADTQVVTVEGDASGFAQYISAGGHAFAADEGLAAGGTGTGPNPYELLLAALGACTSMTVALYARRKQWPLKRVRVQLTHSRVWPQDRTASPTQPPHLERIERVIEFGGDLTEEQRHRLMEIAERCPIHRTLTSKIDIVTSLSAKGNR